MLSGERVVFGAAVAVGRGVSVGFGVFVGLGVLVGFGVALTVCFAAAVPGLGWPQMPQKLPVLPVCPQAGQFQCASRGLG